VFEPPPLSPYVPAAKTPGAMPRVVHTHLQAILGLAFLDPQHTLELWVHHQRPALAVDEDRAVADTGGVRGQALPDP
jgi:hypothetical protein